YIHTRTLRPLGSPLFPYTTLFRSWNWTTNWFDGSGWGGGHVLPYSGTSMHVSDYYDGIHQHWFDKSIVNIHAGPGDVLIAYVNLDRKSTRLNSSHDQISYAVFCLK